MLPCREGGGGGLCCHVETLQTFTPKKKKRKGGGGGLSCHVEGRGGGLCCHVERVAEVDCVAMYKW